MNIIAILIPTLIFLGIVGFGAFMVMKQLKKTDVTAEDSSINDTVDAAQDFLPFKDIKDGVIDLGMSNYRAIIECSSTNYNLKTDKEKQIIEASFQRFLNSLTFPITFYIQTKLLDNTKMMRQMEVELQDVVNQHPQLENYANAYYNEMATLSDNIGNNKQKKKYIIVSYNEALNIKGLTKEEMHEYSVKEIMQRANILIDGLSGVGVKASLLDTGQLLDLIYSVYHKDSFLDYENISEDHFLSLIVQGEKNPEEELTDDMKMDLILNEAQTKIKTQILKKSIPDALKKDYEAIMVDIDSLRGKVGSYFKEGKEDGNIDI